MSNFNASLLGAICTLYLVSSLFFFRYARKTHDKLFGYFAAAFLLLAIERLVMFVGTLSEFQPVIYLFRLSAFVLIIAGVYKKNQGSSQP